MKRLDLTGNPCPIPVVEARKALEQENEKAVQVIVDNLVAVQNLQKMANGTGCQFEWTEYEDDRFLVTLIKMSDITQTQTMGSRLLQTKTIPETKLVYGNTNPHFVVLFTSDCMGCGNDDLGRILIKGYIYTLSELEKLPEAVIFLNGGVHLTTDGANTIADLKNLEGKGSEILSCGTCLNFYNLAEKLEVGSVTDMMDISRRLARAEKLITI